MAEKESAGGRLVAMRKHVSLPSLPFPLLLVTVLLAAGLTGCRQEPSDRRAYQEAYPGEEPDAFAALGYDTARLVLRAVTDAGSDDPEAVRRSLSAISDFEGVTGSLAYPAGGQIPHKSVSVLEVSAGTTRLVRQLVPAEVPAP